MKSEILIIISITLIVLTSIWWFESRLFLVLFQKLVFLFKKFPVVQKEKRAFLDNNLIEKNWEIIKDEYLALHENNKIIPRFHEVDPANKKISFSSGPAWRTFILKAFSGWFIENCKKMPKTYAILRQCKSVSCALISILEPNTSIPEHTGKFKGILRYHLGLIVPKGENCYITIDDKKYYWQEGDSMLFDDTYLHSVNNNTDGYRVVLFLNVQRPMPILFKLINNFLLFLIAKSPVSWKGIKRGKMSF